MKKIIMMLFLCFVMLSPAEASWKECDFPNVLKFAYPDTLTVQTVDIGRLSVEGH